MRKVIALGFVLAGAFSSTIGMSQDFSTEEVRSLRSRADEGNARAQFELAMAYYHQNLRISMDDVPYEPETAIHWLMASARQEYPPALLQLGRNYALGWEVHRSEETAAKLIVKSALLGYDKGQLELARLYSNGVYGLPEDHGESAKWTFEAALQGNGRAMGDMGVLFELGIGVSEDRVSSYAWRNLAVEYGENESPRDLIARVLTGNELRLGQDLTRKLRESIQPLPPSGNQRGPSKSSGTCFAVSSEGLLITSYHVISGGSHALAIFRNGSNYPVSVLAINEKADLALLKIDGKDIDYLPISPSGAAKLGQPVFTIGYPLTSLLGEDEKYTEGSISALSGLGGETSFLQMSVPVHPGNSGGPVVSLYGEVVGIVASTAAFEEFFNQTGAAPQNVNWAVKSEYATELIGAQKPMPAANDKQAAIERTQAAICKLLVEK